MLVVDVDRHAEVGAVLVERVIGQVLEVVIHGLWIIRKLNLLVLTRREPHEAILMQEHSEGFAAKHKHVQTQIKLEAVDQVGFLQILLNHVWLGRDRIQVVSHEDALSLA